MSKVDRLEKILEEIKSEYRQINAVQMDLWRKIQSEEDQKVAINRSFRKFHETLELIDNRLNVHGDLIKEAVNILKDLQEAAKSDE